MDPVSLIVAALAAGATAGVTGAASSAVQDAYSGLKALVRGRLAGRGDGELVLARHAQAPDAWAGPLSAELTAAGAGSDAGLIAAAHMVMALADGAGSRAGKYVVQVSGGQGVQVGDGN
ncbi:MAG: hypothetical protein ACRDPO_25545 [Streptosporangiaceae bacterium]